MTKEQEEAIELLIQYKNDELFGIAGRKAFETVLKMLKEKDAEIEKYKQLYNKALDDAVITAHDNIKKDKMIDLMTEYIINSNNEEGICLKVEDSCFDYAGQNGKTCDTCIKQYFERKVEDECKR